MPRSDTLLARALLEASLRTDPQLGALRALLSERAQTYSRDRAVNASNERGIVAATREATPRVQGAFDQALASVTAQRAALGQGSDPQAFAFQRRVGEQRANALTDLSDRQTRATEGRVFANQQARSEYVGDKQKIRGQLIGLLGERGALRRSGSGSSRTPSLIVRWRSARRGRLSAVIVLGRRRRSRTRRPLVSVLSRRVVSARRAGRR